MSGQNSASQQSSARQPPAPHQSYPSVEKESFQLIKNLVNSWSKKYTIQVFFQTRDIEGLRFVAQFSQPTMQHPIPQATVKVYFTVAISTIGQKSIFFSFENQSLTHTLDNTMQQGQYQRWIDRILDNKLRVRKQLHLGTEFEFSRFKDKKGQILDPFKGIVNILTATDLQQQLKKAQSVNIQSPRFDSNLRKNLQKLFMTVDTDGSGQLQYQEFQTALKGLSFNLTEQDMATLIAMADENQDGKIQYDEFIPIGIDLIKTFIARDKALQREALHQDQVNKQALNLVMWDEIKNADTLMQRKFAKMDTQGSGQITDFQLKKAFLNVSVITPLEMNILMHRARKNKGFQYKGFGNELFQIRYEIARSRLLETNLSGIGEQILQRCKMMDLKNTGGIKINDLKEVLSNTKKINLSPFQMQMLVGMSQPDQENNVDYKKFAFRSGQMIQKLFSLKSMEEKGKFLKEQEQKGRKDITSLQHTQEPELSKMELFNLFKRFDENKNGTLDMNQYVKCLSQADLKLSKQEIIALAVSADTDKNGQIPYQEFMKHFNHVLKMIKVHRALSNAIHNFDGKD